MSEKIIQIAVSSGGEANAIDVIYALSSDGRIFRLTDSASDYPNERKWLELNTPFEPLD